jgi:hypothetical protein
LQLPALIETQNIIDPYPHCSRSGDIAAVIVNLELIDTVNCRVLKHGVLRPVAIGVICVKLRVAGAGIPGIVPIGVMFNTILIIVRRGKIAVTKAIAYLITWGDEVGIYIGTVGVPGKLYSNRNDRDIGVDINGIAATLVLTIGSCNRYSVPALMKLNRGVEAIDIAA